MLLHLIGKAKHWLARAKGGWELASVWFRAGEPFRRCVAKQSINFEEILSRTNGNFKDVLESSIVIINHCTIIINAY